jgi:hypothetical protein
MTLTNPCDALAEQSSFVGYLLGLTGIATAIRQLAGDDAGFLDPPSDADDFVLVLLGIASLGEQIERLGETAAGQPDPTTEPTATTFRWLR